jgi:NifU-like protein involved in Fe-S cluster formation
MSEIREIVRRLRETDQAAELTENLTEMIQRDTASGQHEQIDAAAQLEEDLTALIRRDIPPSRHRDSEPVANPTSGHLNGLLQQVGGVSIEEIDRIILELQNVRDMLRGESERLSNEVARYADLNNTTMTLMRSLADRLKLSKSPENGNTA